MVIEFKPGVFDTPKFKPFNYLFQICTNNNRYEVLVDYVKILEKDLFKRLDVEDREFIIRNFDAQMTKQTSSGSTGKNIINADYFVDLQNPKKENNIFDIKEATVFFEQKPMIILENSLNDAYFLKAVIGYFDSVGEVKRHLDNKWIGFENAGGCTNEENFILGKLQDYDLLEKDNHHYIRAFVLLDSDRESADQHINYKHRNLIKFLKSNNIGYHVLEKRMMENYIPDEVIEEYDGKFKDWAKSYLHLSDRQKDFLNISKGFSKKNSDGSSKKSREQLEPNTRALYTDLSDKNYNLLDKGLMLEDFKTEFPKNFTDNPKVNFDSLTDRVKHQDNPGEFYEIIQKIAKLI